MVTITNPFLSKTNVRNRNVKINEENKEDTFDFHEMIIVNGTADSSAVGCNVV